MSSISEWFGWSRTPDAEELPEIFPMAVSQVDFVDIDASAIYSKIMTDVLERTHGLADEQIALMWDNCVKSNSSHGLISMLSHAMVHKTDLFLVFDKAAGVIRKANSTEESTIREDYAKQAESKVGIYISFKNFKRSDMVRLYIALEYCTVSSLHKSMNLSKAVQLKMNDLRASVSLADSADVKKQGQAIAQSLSKGKDILIDAKDIIETATPDLTAVNASIDFLIQKLSFYLGLPDSYLKGEQTSGLSSSGENDARAVERGLKAYYFSIIKPVVEALFGIKVSYKTQDFRQIAGSMDVLKTFALIDDILISQKNKLKIVNQILDLPEDAIGDAPKEAVAVPPAVAPVAPPGAAAVK